MVLLVAVATFAGIYQARDAASPRRDRRSRAPCISTGNSSKAISAARSSRTVPSRVRGIGQQYSFTPSCIVVPTDTPVTFRATSADVVHGFLITGTNINLMLVPGYISSLNARFDSTGERLMPCHEFCGMGHEGMWGRIKVIDKAAFARLAADRRRLSCVE